jgi:hypothetical protein
VLLDDADRRSWLAVLAASRRAGTENRALDVVEIASELNRSTGAIWEVVGNVEKAGLAFFGDDLREGPIVTEAGEEFVAAGGDVPSEELSFLPKTIRNLLARRALLSAGSLLVDEFRHALLNDGGVAHARELVPPAFAAAVDERLALNLYAAAVALMARLSADEPAGCVAEEIIAIALIEEAKAYLEAKRDEGSIGSSDVDRGICEFDALFDLFEDDDVRDLFGMAEPADAAVSRHDPFNRELGVVDQRLESWFRPFSWTSPTGYLDDPAC